MLIPKTLLYCIMNERGSIPVINMGSVRKKRAWRNKSPEEKAAFSKMRSETQKRVFQEQPHLRKIRAESFRKATQKYWDTVDEEKKAQHIKNMSKGMKKAWDEADENFGPKIAVQKNVKMFNGDVEVIDNLPRINDYCGVITESQMRELYAEN